MVYFWGLWVTLRKLSESLRPARLIIVSYIIRLGVILAGFYLVMGCHWERLAAAMIGFIMMREILLRRWGKDRVILR
ncbi:MAG: ATP synthase subunit I [Deltaproteobacteria bacterium]|nr:ATP synthase subunit I [Deltaproteobacteria bacterium]